MLLAAAATATPVLVGHSRTTEPVWLMIAADVSHLIVGAFWTGGVIGLLLFLKSASPRRGGTSTDVERATRVTARFSRFALYSVLLLALSGTVMTVLIIDAPAQLVDTGYGLTLLLKLSICFPHAHRPRCVEPHPASPAHPRLPDCYSAMDRS